MKRLLVAVLLLTTLSLPSLAQKKGADDFNDLIKRYYAAWSTLNPDNASFLYAKDADLFCFDMPPWRKSGGGMDFRVNLTKIVAPGVPAARLTPGKASKVPRRGSMAYTPR